MEFYKLFRNTEILLTMAILIGNFYKLLYPLEQYDYRYTNYLTAISGEPDTKEDMIIDVRGLEYENQAKDFLHWLEPFHQDLESFSKDISRNQYHSTNRKEKINTKAKKNFKQWRYQ